MLCFKHCFHHVPPFSNPPNTVFFNRLHFLKTLQSDSPLLFSLHFPIPNQIPFAILMLLHALLGNIFKNIYCITNWKKYLKFSTNNQSPRGKVSIISIKCFHFFKICIRRKQVLRQLFCTFLAIHHLNFSLCWQATYAQDEPFETPRNLLFLQHMMIQGCMHQTGSHTVKSRLSSHSTSG